MSSTRHAEAERPLRQERFCSSPEFERGVMANLVAKRCDVLDDAQDRELVYFLQLLSHREGGLAKVAAEMVAMFPGRFATKSMQRFGMKAGQVYSAQQVRTVRAELEGGDPGERLGEDCTSYPLKSDGWVAEDLASLTAAEPQKSSDWQTSFDVEGKHSTHLSPDYYARIEAINRRKAQLKGYPDSYPAQVFVDACRDAARQLGEYLARLCLDPAIDLKKCGLPYCPDFLGVLRDYHRSQIAQAGQAVVVTELGKQVYDALDYALESRCMVLIDGLARTGKTFAAKAWCEAHPGRARYVQVPSSNDDMSFFRAIARGLGVSSNLNYKARQLRDRVEDVLQRGHLLLCLDEAHYIWPQSSCRDVRMPGRVNWIMTALVNQGVPVALVATPQFFKTQRSVEKRTCWTSEQFTGRIGHYQKLPDSLSLADLNAVAKELLPEGDATTIKMLVKYAQGSLKYLAGLELVARRVRYLIRREGRNEVNRSDLCRVIKESVFPSDAALAAALAEPVREGRKRSRLPVAEDLQDPGTPVADLLPAPGTGTAGRINFAGAEPAQALESIPGRNRIDQVQLVGA